MLGQWRGDGDVKNPESSYSHGVISRLGAVDVEMHLKHSMSENASEHVQMEDGDWFLELSWTHSAAWLPAFVECEWAG